MKNFTTLLLIAICLVSTNVASAQFNMDKINAEKAKLEKQANAAIEENKGKLQEQATDAIKEEVGDADGDIMEVVKENTASISEKVVAQAKAKTNEMKDNSKKKKEKKEKKVEKENQEVVETQTAPSKEKAEELSTSIDEGESKMTVAKNKIVAAYAKLDKDKLSSDISESEYTAQLAKIVNAEKALESLQQSVGKAKNLQSSTSK